MMLIASINKIWLKLLSGPWPEKLLAVSLAVLAVALSAVALTELGARLHDALHKH